MNDTKHHDDFSSLTIDQLSELAAAVHETFGGNLSRGEFIDRLLMFIEDVPGFEADEVPQALIESAWAEYGSHRR
ncbi:hypothetical protein DF113_11510 [Burkholderia stagnalis]|uniref:hypothetical protein n=1 Tax=Burkholderia stagnalis TaxID=1503054 RepID=UPI000F5F61B0|nr:hypothetical protein [Burkholderia stagnalis]RQY42870.1 hypothetical protein DF113_11510 [Burkholderia stagnalis]